MIVIPAIDLLNAQAVRLYKGDYAKKTLYGENPAKLAAQFENMGAKYLHIVDLDGAKSGSAANLETIRDIRRSVSVPIQLGGGVRTAETAALYLESVGIDRVILGTAAVKNPEFLAEMLKKYGGERIIAGVDVRDGKAASDGWLSDSGADYLELIGRLKGMGALYAVVTDISRDGTLTSPNWDMYEKITGINVIVSGGVSCEADIARARGFYGVIVGKAYYEGKVNLKKMMEKRIVPCLDTVNGRVVKGVNFLNLADVGDPAEIAAEYERQGADEIVLLDITATGENRETAFTLLERVKSRVTVPVTLGGGIRGLEDFRKAVAFGADKVSVNSAAAADPNLIRQASAEFGRKRVVAAIDGKGRRVYVRGGREDTGLDIAEWAKECEALGAGEILLTSMDGDGTQAGYDIAMTQAVCEAVTIPVTASGGCGSVEHIIDLFKKTDCGAALAASLFHYGKATVGEVKSAMRREGIPCR